MADNTVADNTMDTQLTTTDYIIIDKGIIIALILATIMLFTIVGNILVIWAIFTYRPLHNVQNMFLVSLAVSDIAVAVLVMPFNVAYNLLGKWIFGLHICEMWLTSDVLCCTASILNLCAIAMDRYWAIHDPINYAQKRTMRRVVTTIALIWAISALISIPPLIGWNDWPSVFDDNTPCKLSEERSYVVYSASGSFFIPLVIMTVVYIKIFKATRRRLRDRAKASAMANLMSANSKTNNCVSESHRIDIESASDEKTEKVVNNINNKDNNGGGGGGGDKGLPPQQPLTNNNRRPSLKQDLKDRPLLLSKSSDEHRELKKHSDDDDDDDNDSDNSDADDNNHQRQHQQQIIIPTGDEFVSQYNTTTTTTCTSGDGLSIGQSVGGVGDGQQQQQQPTALTTPTTKKVMVCTTVTIASSDNISTGLSSESPDPHHNHHQHHHQHHYRPKAQSISSELVVTNKLLNCFAIQASKRRPMDSNNSDNQSSTAVISVKRFWEEKQKISLSRERRATRILGIVMGVFVACWLPFFLMYVIMPFCGSCYLPKELENFITWLGYINSALNPLIYCGFNRDFRKAFQKIICCRK